MALDSNFINKPKIEISQLIQILQKVDFLKNFHYQINCYIKL